MSPNRYKRIREMLAKRQSDLVVCMEHVHKPHNVSAIVRTCDAVGVHYVHGVWDESTRLRGGTALGSQIWTRMVEHETIGDAIGHFHQQDMQVVVTHLSDSAVDFREVDYTKPTAILLGQEKTGATADALDGADQDIVIPMVGMVQSLNVSVAAATVLYEAQRQRQAAGMYQQQTLPEDECQRILFEGGHPIYYKLCKHNDIPFPRIDEQGQIDADQAWWERFRTAKRP